MDKILLQSAKTGGTDDWTTPPDLFAYLSSHYGPFDLDPCASKDGARLPVPVQYTIDDDGLSKSWNVHPSKITRAFVNPPYSEIGKWVDKALTEQLDFCFLVPARTDTKWFYKLYQHSYTLAFIKGRLRFGNQKNSAPFPSAIFVGNSSVRNSGCHGMFWSRDMWAKK